VHAFVIRRWVRDDVVRTDGTQHRVIADDPVCYRPLYLYNIAVSQVPPYDFTCDHDYYDYYYEDTDAADYESEHYDTVETNNDTIFEKWTITLTGAG